MEKENRLVFTPEAFQPREARPIDYPYVLEMNEAEVPRVSSLRLASLEALASECVYFKVITTRADKAIAFLMALREGKNYSSENYRWFSNQMQRFLYIDRVVVEKKYHRLGLGRKLYEDLATFAKAENLVRTCEVNIEPPNPTSQKFHEKMGFKKIGEQWTKSNTIQVAMLAAEKN